MIDWASFALGVSVMFLIMSGLMIASLQEAKQMDRSIDILNQANEILEEAEALDND